MDEKTILKTENDHNVSIALISRDIQYIKESVSKLANDVNIMDKNFARRDELTLLTKTLDEIVKTLASKVDHSAHEEVKKTLDGKVNVTDFAPIKSVLYRINWILILTVVTGLIALLYKAGK